MNGHRRFLTTILTLMFIGFIPPSCCLITSCGCGNVSPKDFYITGIELVSVNSANVEVDTSLYYAHTDLFKVIRISETQTIALNTNFSTFSLFSVALACSPAPSVALNPIEDIKIVAVNSFLLESDSDVISIDQDISDRFEIGYVWDNSFSSINNFLTNDISYIGKQDQYRIRPAAKPFQETNMRLDISILLTDGTLFEYKSEIMNVK
jgi:hypothetical protein